MVIVDLYSQRDAVASKLRQISDSDRIPWLQSRGELVEIPVPSPARGFYLFRSNSGIETKFCIRDNEMVFLGDHTTIGSVIID